MRDRARGDAFRRIDAAEVDRPLLEGGQAREATIPRTPVVEHRVAGLLLALPAAGLHVLPDGEEALGMGEVQRAQQDAVDSAEDRGIEPDADSQGEHGGHAEPARLAERAQRMAKIGDHVTHLASAAARGATRIR